MLAFLAYLGATKSILKKNCVFVNFPDVLYFLHFPMLGQCLFGVYSLWSIAAVIYFDLRVEKDVKACHPNFNQALLPLLECPEEAA